MPLATDDRIGVWAQFQRRETESFGTLLKADLMAAVSAVDAWMDANAASFNAAIPQPAQAQLTAKQKARLLAEILQRRFEMT